MKKILFCLCMTVCLFTLAAAAPLDTYLAERAGFLPGTQTLRVLIDDINEKSTALDSAAVTLDGMSLENAAMTGLDGTDVPVVWLFLVDTSNSVYSSEKEAADVIAREISTKRGNHPDDTYILVSFDDDIAVEGIASKPGIMLRELKFAGNSSDYTEALSYALNYLSPRDSFEKQVVILLTDGALPAAPMISADRLAELIGQSTPQLFTVGLRNSNLAAYIDSDLDSLSRLAAAGHGKGYSTKTSGSAAQIAEEILKTVNRSFVVSGDVPADFGNSGTDKFTAEVSLLRSDGTLIGKISSDVNWERTADVTPDETAPVTDTGVSDKEPGAELPSGFIFSEWIKGETTIASFSIPNLYLMIFASVLLLAVIIMVISAAARSSKQKKDRKLAAQKKEAEEKSLEVRLTDGQSAPITVMISDGETKIFGRRDNREKQIIGLNGDPAVSSKHFSLTYDMGKLYIMDEGSSNGTMVNGSRIQSRTRLTSGQILLVGESEFRITFGSAAGDDPTQIIG